MIASARDIELDAGPRAQELERMCVATRTVMPVADMIRFVIGPDGEAVPDLKRKLPGRGVWVTATQDALSDAVKRKALARGFKREVRLPADLVARTGQLLERAALDALAMVYKAGRIIAGFERVESAIAAGGLAALIHAADAAPDGVRKLGGRAEGQFPVISTFTSSQLDLALGRPHVIHAALLSGREGETFLARWRTLERYRMNAGRGAPKRAGHEAVQPDAARKLGTE